LLTLLFRGTIVVVSGGHFPLKENRKTRENTKWHKTASIRCKKATVLPLEIPGIQPKGKRNSDGLKTQQTA